MVGWGPPIRLEKQPRWTPLCRAQTLLAEVSRERGELQGERGELRGRLARLELERAQLEAQSQRLRESNQQLDLSACRLTTQCEVRGAATGWGAREVCPPHPFHPALLPGGSC